MQFLNPIPVAVLLIPVGDGILTVRRGIPPHVGELAFPGGFLESGESWQDGAARELMEEANIQIEPQSLRVFDMSSTLNGRILLFCEGPAIDPEALKGFKPNTEVQELVVLNDPTQLAFPLHTNALAKWFASQHT
jgi:ADP-ribose pyrophosphatase YjhB (NUDIX family)